MASIAFIGFGEAASTFLEAWCNDVPVSVRAYDVKSDTSGREQQAADYAKAGVLGCDTVDEAVNNASVVFSLVTADQALTAAESAVEHIEAGALYLDCNSCASSSKQAADKLVTAAGGCYVDVAIMAPVNTDLTKVPVLLSGPHAEVAERILQDLGMYVEVISGGVGAAATVKMLRSIMVKGMEALVLECVLSARKAGVDAAVLGSLDASDHSFGWYDKASYMLERSMKHGVRRAAEMREATKTVKEIGVSSVMSDASVFWQQTVGELGLVSGLQGAGYAERADEILNHINHKVG